MEKNNRKKGKTKTIIAAIAVVLVAIIVIYGIVQSKNKQSAVMAQAGKIDCVEKRTIVNSLSGTGKVESVSREEITADVAGVDVKQILVSEGDIVSAGDVIAYLDTESLVEQRNDIVKNIDDAKSEKIEQDTEYDNTITDNKKSREKQIAETQKKYDAAKKEYKEAKADLKKAQNDYDAMIKSGVKSTDPQASAMAGTIESKKQNVEAKKQTMDTYKSQIETLKGQDDSTTADAKENYDDTADSNIKSMEESLADIDENIAKCTVRCTISGTVTSVGSVEGGNYNGTAIAVIEGEDELLIEAKIDEYDIADVAVGQKALVKTDSTRDEELGGTVTFVAPRASSDNASLGGMSSLVGMDLSGMTGESGSSSASYLVKISLDKPNDRLRLGMNARVSIITQESEDVLSVPYDAVYTDEKSGDKYVYLVNDKTDPANKDKKLSVGDKVDGDLLDKKKVTVVTGIEGTYYIEVSGKGISEGMYVFVPDTGESNSVDDILNVMGSNTGV